MRKPLQQEGHNFRPAVPEDLFNAVVKVHTILGAHVMNNRIPGLLQKSHAFGPAENYHYERQHDCRPGPFRKVRPDNPDHKLIHLHAFDLVMGGISNEFEASSSTKMGLACDTEVHQELRQIV